MPYNHLELEKKWISKWTESNLYATPDINAGDLKKYILIAFPYPSADGLHVGHPLSFTGADILSRYYRATGHKVLYPIGWDAFGLPTENFAKKKGLHPQDVTNNSIANFKDQVMRLGASFDWNREVNTSSPDYYKWTQWFFQLMYERGLAYKKEALVNWDPVDMTVLANEQVLADGTAERSGARVEQKMMSQWFFKISDYAERLITGLDGLDWPESTKLQQKNWIGKSVGAEVDFEVINDLEQGSPLTKEGEVFIFHGRSFSRSDSFYSKTIENLESKSYKVNFVEVKNPLETHSQNWIEAFQNTNLNQNSIIITHSIASLAFCKYLSQNSELKINKWFSVGGIFDFAREGQTQEITDTINLFEQNKIDYQKIDNQIQEITILHSTDDDKVSFENLSRYFKVFPKVKLVELNNYKHFQDKDINFVELNNLFVQTKPTKITVFTTRIDTLYSGTFLLLAPENPLVEGLTTLENKASITEYLEITKGKSQLERTDLNKNWTGCFTGSYAINPATGDRMPIWITDFVLANYGTGAVFADAHDERDFYLAKKYNIPLKTSLKPFDVEDDSRIKNLEECYRGYGILYNSGQFDGLTSDEAKVAILDYGIEQDWAKKVVNYRLRDWSIGRQRYWGCPIPVIYGENGQEKLISEQDLPLLLPKDLDLSTGMIKPLAQNLEFVNSASSKYGEGWSYEGDTMDTFVCSSWYFFRYCSGNLENVFARPEDLKSWAPVDEYIIGAEHTVLHLLYSRFFTKVLHDAGYIDFDEPFLKMRHQGMILGPDNQKMSKSKGNVVNPNEVYDEYGADTLRVYEMFMGPFEQSKPWSTDSIKGVRRFLDRVWNMQDRVYHEEDEATIHKYKGMKVEVALHKLVKKIGEDILDYSFNTCVSEFMKFVNLVEDIGHIQVVQFEWFLTVLAPFAPFVTEDIWNVLGKKESIHLQQWPQYMPSMMIEDEVTIGVQINGKARTEITLSPTESLESAQTKVMELDIVKKYLEGNSVKKFIYVAGKIVNIVIS